MTIRVLIVDPDIPFAVPIKRALEQSGDYAVNVFANGKAAIEMVLREPHDVAILDFNVGDMDMPTLIRELREVQAGLFILASPRTNDHVAQLPALDVQGSITKPYFARQLVPVIREAAAARARLAKKERERRVEALSAEAASTNAPAATVAPVTPPPAAQIPEPTIQPDDTFQRLIHELSTSENVQALGLPPVEIEEPPIPDDATIRDLVSGQPRPPAPPESMPEVESIWEPPPQPVSEPEPISDLAVAALNITSDDTVPMEHVTPEIVIAKADPNLADFPLPVWPNRANAQSPEQPIRSIQHSIQEPSRADDDTHKSAQVPAVSVESVLAEIAESVGRGEIDEVQHYNGNAEPAEPPSIDGDTEPGGGVVQRKFEETPQQQIETPPPSVQAAAAESVEPVEALPEAPLEEPSFVATMLDEAPPTAFAQVPTPAEAIEPAAALAVQLTQVTVNSTARATLLSSAATGELLASAGSLDEQAIANVLANISAAWQGAEDNGSALVRFIHVAKLGDFLLYSTRTVEDMILSMLFPSETPLRIIRQQARQLIQALDTVPEPPPLEAEAASTLPSRPTDLRPPEGLREAVGVTDERFTADEGFQAPGSEPAPASPPEPPRAEGPYTTYAFVWLPQASTISQDVADVVVDWLTAIATQHAWQVEGVEVQPTYITVQISIPANETPTATVEVLMRETAARANDKNLWADAYYIVAPGRAVTQQEIASFMEYRRDAQDAA
jgi:DNA-binding NarL/FixJ family response regulator